MQPHEIPDADLIRSVGLLSDPVVAELARRYERSLSIAERALGGVAELNAAKAEIDRLNAALRDAERRLEWRVKQSAFSALDAQAPDWWHDLDVGDRPVAVADECQRLMDAAATVANGGTNDR